MERNLRKQREGVVTSNKMNKTITVEVLRRVKHPIYGKFVKKSSKRIFPLTEVVIRTPFFPNILAKCKGPESINTPNSIFSTIRHKALIEEGCNLLEFFKQAHSSR